ncbi:rhogap domain containing protein [Entamoeba histolytica]|nr:rhogap domain containing protein [Entamoeba histolytica]
MNPTLATPRRTRPKVMELRLTHRDDNQENNQQFVGLKADKQNLSTLSVFGYLDEVENSVFCLFYLKNANHFVKSKFNLIRMNKLYGKSTPSTPRSLKSPRKKFSSPELQEELLKYMEKYRMIGDNFVWLSGLLSTFQIKFSDYSQKKLIRLYISIFSADPSITDGVSVLLSYDTSNKKSRSIQLIKNFLFIGKEETKEIDHVIYLTKPRLILINETTISFDNITIDFKDRDVCVKWIDDLTNLQPWYVTVPRTIIRKDDASLIMFNPPHITIVGGDRNRSSNDLVKSQGSLTALIQKPVSTPNNGLSPRSKGFLSKGFINRLSGKSKTTKIIKVVGVSLEVLSTENNIITLPPNISLLIQYLKKYAITIEGIFRVSGSKEHIQKVVEKLDTKIITFECLTNFDIHSVAGALKLYIKSLPEQVIPKSIDDRLYELWKQKDTLQEDDLFLQFYEIYKDIPPMTFNFLNELLGLLHSIAMNKEITKMNIENCVTCLAPSLRGYPFVYTYSIQHYSQLFQQKPKDSK